MNKELKPCPLCGGEAFIEQFEVRKGFEAVVGCCNCLLRLDSITYDTKEEAVEEATKTWNKRVGEELVEKATPKKVQRRDTDGEEIKVGNLWFKMPTLWYCPNCGEWIAPSSSKNNCGHCGQALDWSEDDENS